MIENCSYCGKRHDETQLQKHHPSETGGALTPAYMEAVKWSQKATGGHEKVGRGASGSVDVLEMLNDLRRIT